MGPSTDCPRLETFRVSTVVARGPPAALDEAEAVGALRGEGRWKLDKDPGPRYNEPCRLKRCYAVVEWTQWSGAERSPTRHDMTEMPAVMYVSSCRSERFCDALHLDAVFAMSEQGMYALCMLVVPLRIWCVGCRKKRGEVGMGR